MCCSVMCVAATATHSVLRGIAICCSMWLRVLQCDVCGGNGNTECIVGRCSALQCVAVCGCVCCGVMSVAATAKPGALRGVEVCGYVRCSGMCVATTATHGVLQGVAICCNVWLRMCSVMCVAAAATHRVLRGVALCCSVWLRVLRCDVCGSNGITWRVAVCCSVLQCVAVCCSMLQCIAVCCSVLQLVAAC